MLRRRSRLVSVILLALLIVSGLGLFALAPTATANHETVDWSRFWPSPFDPRHQFFPSVFTDQQGGLYFFQFDQNPANGNMNVTVSKHATRGPTGNPEWEFTSVVNPTMPNVVFVGNPYFYIKPPTPAMDHNGALYVAWTDSSHDVYVSQSSDGGRTWGAPSRVDSTVPDYDDYVPEIVAVPNGDLYVVWLQFWFPGNLRSLASARSTDEGQSWSGTTNITTGADYYTSDLASDSIGRLHLTYTSYVSPGPNAHVNYTNSDDGTTWSAPMRLDGGLDGRYPAILTDSSDRVHVLWYDARQSPGGTRTYWYLRSDDRGTSWTMEIPVSQGRYSTGGVSGPTLAVHGETVIAGWYAFAGTNTLGYAVSADGGNLWHPEKAAEFGVSANNVVLGADENGTFYAGFFYFSSGFDLGYSIWDGPPSAPTITDIGRSTGSLTVSWTGSPEGDVAGYRLWRSTDGVSYELAGTFDSTTRGFADSGLADGVYWYRVTSFDSRGTSSHESDPMSASVGLSLSEEIADLQAQLAALEDQSSQEAAALRDRIDELQNQLNAIQAEKATQAQSFLNTILLVIVILLLVFMFLQSRRRSMMTRPMQVPPMAPTPPMTPSWQPPPTPPTPPQPSKPPETGFPEEEL
jgi:hypothetical protein